MQIWLKGSRPLRFPVLPAEYKITSSRGVDTVNINAIGEVDIGGNRNLKEVSFSSFFPKRYDQGYCEVRRLKDPMSYVRQIESIMELGPAKIILTGTAINFTCRVTSFEWGENDGTGDVNFSITLKEHRKIAISKSAVTVENAAGVGEAASQESSQREDNREKPKTYTVKKGDCLSSIARQLTGSANWRPLYEQNKNIIGSNPNLIRDGTVLVIP